MAKGCNISPKLGEPGFSVKNCDSKTVIDVKTKYADAVYAMFKRTRYGIDTCCEQDLDKLDIKNQLIDLGATYDPDLCVDGNPVTEECCLQPCNAEAMVCVPDFSGCPEPIDVTVDVSIPAEPCLAPTTPIISVVAINPRPDCKQARFINQFDPTPLNLSYEECDGTIVNTQLARGQGLVACIVPGTETYDVGVTATIFGTVCT